MSNPPLPPGVEAGGNVGRKRRGPQVLGTAHRTTVGDGKVE